MRYDVFRHHYDQNIDQYFYYLELADDLESQGKTNQFKHKLVEISEKQKELEKKYYDQLKVSNFHKWNRMSSHIKGLKQNR